jgi:hypothetical protein
MCEITSEVNKMALFIQTHFILVGTGKHHFTLICFRIKNCFGISRAKKYSALFRPIEFDCILAETGCCSLPQCPGWLWHPPSLFSRYRDNSSCCEADHSPPFNVKVNNGGTISPPPPPPIWLHGIVLNLEQ